MVSWNAQDSMKPPFSLKLLRVASIVSTVHGHRNCLECSERSRLAYPMSEGEDMNICLIMDNPETPHHPVVAVTLQQLSATHTVRLLDVRALTGAEAIEQEKIETLADLYLLKSHSPQALDIAHFLEQQGALVVNSWASSSACQDRVLMAQRMLEANLPWPQTWSFATLENLLADSHLLASLPFPLIIKSQYSHRGDLVDKVHNVEQLQALAAQWSREPVVLQEFVAGDGWHIKL